MKTRVHLSLSGPSGPSAPEPAGAGQGPRRENVSTPEIHSLIRIMIVLSSWKCQKVVMTMFDQFGHLGQTGQNAPKLVVVELGRKFGNVYCQKALMDVSEIPRPRRVATLRNVQFGLHGPSGQNAPRLVTEEGRGGTVSVSCPRDPVCSVRGRTTRRGTVTSTGVQSGLSGPTGHPAPRRVAAVRGRH